ncbi:MAG: hypothetical protein JJU02_13580 [Cryomorphaceae bacterium]|nr:hypothetical protein [Cryomorphaceae bacterium]
MRNLLIALFLTFSSLGANLFKGDWTHAPLIEWDVINYYGYVPYINLHKNPNIKVWNSHRVPTFLYYYENSSPEKMTMGMAVIYTPGFWVAHALANSLGHESNGLTRPYQIAVHFSLYLYLFLGWWALLAFWKKLRYPTWSVIVAACLLLFGTNLAFYSVDQPAMTHGFTFSLVSILLYVSALWWDKKKLFHLLSLAALLGLIVLIRPVNAMFILLPLLIGLAFYPPKKVFAVVWENKWGMLLGIVVGLAVIFPQLWYWKSGFDKWFIYSYGDERFFWRSPNILNGLFSYRKGWFLYTPLGMAMLLGFIPLFKKNKWMATGMLSFLLLFIYVAFSWWCWWYGGSFSQRVMIDIYPLLSVPLIHLIMMFKPKSLSLIFGGLLFVGFISYNLVSIAQFRKKLIHHDANSKCSFHLNFMKINTPKHDWWDLLYQPDYDAAMKNEEVYPPQEGWKDYCHSRK